MLTLKLPKFGPRPHHERDGRRSATDRSQGAPPRACHEGADMTMLSNRADGTNGDVDWADLGQAMWDYLTGRGAAINYTFQDMAVEVPRDTGADAPRATWVFNGNLRITTSDDTTASSEA
jgi:hypothetical protein